MELLFILLILMLTIGLVFKLSFGLIKLVFGLIGFVLVLVFLPIGLALLFPIALCILALGFLKLLF